MMLGTTNIKLKMVISDLKLRTRQKYKAKGRTAEERATNSAD